MNRLSLGALRKKLPAIAGEALEADTATAAVATILREGQDGAEVLLIKRAERETDPWSGHLAFPGGKREPHDPSLLVTSVRETEEEVGLRLSPSSLVVRLDDVRAHTAGLRVAQFVFALDDPAVTLTISQEVAATLWVSLARIEAAEGKDTMVWKAGERSMTLPCVKLGDYVLWGMTYRMVSQVIAADR